MDLWFAGQETTTLTLYWAFAFLLLHENVIIWPVFQWEYGILGDEKSRGGIERSYGEKEATPFGRQVPDAVFQCNDYGMFRVG